jgi:hypothetical protein
VPFADQQDGQPDLQGRWNLGISYQRVKFDTLDGKDLRTLSDTRPPIRLKASTPGGSFVFPLVISLLDLDLDTQQVTASATYGAGDDLDLNITVPVLYSEFETRARAGIRGAPAATAPCVGHPCRQRESKLGIGDTFLRAKYRFAREAWAQAAAGLVLRLPTGSEDNFQGAGATQLAPMLYVMSRRFSPAAAVTFVGYINAGMTLDATDVDHSEGRWGTGLDLGIADRATAGVAVLGRHALQRPVPADAFDVPRCAPSSGFACPKDGRAPLFGIESTRPDFYDFSTGLRVDVWRDVLIAFAGVVVPLNDSGLRADLIPLVGLEGSF